MHPLDALMGLFQSGNPAQPASAAGPNQQSPMDWLAQFHNFLAAHSGGMLNPSATYTNDPSKAPTGYSWQDIAKQAQLTADAQAGRMPAKRH